MSKSSTCVKQLKPIYRELIRQGWRCDASGPHLRWYPPDADQPPATVGRSPSPSAYRNIVADLRRRGARI